MEEKAAAVDLTLAPDVVERLNNIPPPKAAAGARFAAGMNALLNR